MLPSPPRIAAGGVDEASVLPTFATIGADLNTSYFGVASPSGAYYSVRLAGRDHFAHSRTRDGRLHHHVAERSANRLRSAAIPVGIPRGLPITSEGFLHNADAGEPLDRGHAVVARHHGTYRKAMLR